MAIEYRDYGSMGYMQPSSVAVDTSHRRQVYQATHGGDGSRLPFMNRSFISFTYGGKPIEDFDLIASITGDRLQRAGYASFEDTVTTYDNLDGQFYWATHYKSNALSFQLATDGIDQKTLDEFLHWFRAGEIKELILSEHPNRAIMARVAQPPQLQLLPFEHNIDIMISGSSYSTKTTLYKGEISLEFIMDEPHWYGLTNVLGIPAIDEEKQKLVYKDLWTDANGNTVDIFHSQDALKILQEDGIPLGSMIKNNMLLGNGSFANVETDVNGRIWKWPEGHENEWAAGEPLGEGARIAGTIYVEDIVITDGSITPEQVEDDEGNNLMPGYDVNEQGEVVKLGYASVSQFAMTTEDCKILMAEDGTDLQYDRTTDIDPNNLSFLHGTYEGHISGADVDVNSQGIPALTNNEIGYFYYAGTAPAPTRITFTIYPPKFTNENKYISIPKNSYVDKNQPYNYLTITSETEQTLKFTTPNLYTSYNRAIKLLNERITGTYGWEEIFNEVRDTIRHAGVRAWLAYVLTGLKKHVNNAAVDKNMLDSALSAMTKFIEDDNNNIFPATFTFDSKTGEAYGQFTYRIPTESLSYGAVYDVHPQKGNMQEWLEHISTYSADDQLRNIKEVCGNDYETYLSRLNISVDADDAEIVEAFLNEIQRCYENNIIMPPFLKLDFRTDATTTTVTEDVGDMLYSNYLIIKDRNYPTEYGSIAAWEDTPQGHTYSHKITHDVEVPLRDLQIIYTNMYL